MFGYAVEEIGAVGKEVSYKAYIRKDGMSNRDAFTLATPIYFRTLVVFCLAADLHMGSFGGYMWLRYVD